MKFIENKLRSYLRKKAEKILLSVKKETEHLPQTRKEALQLEMEIEQVRILSMIDHSVLIANLKRANKTLLKGGILSILLGTASLAIRGGFSPLSIIIVLLPFVGALGNWLITIDTLPDLYIERVEGGLISTIEKEKMTHQMTSSVSINIPSEEMSVPSKNFSMFSTVRKSPALPPPLPGRRASL